MLLKALLLTTLVASTPIAITLTQEQKQDPTKAERPSTSAAELRRLENERQRAASDLQRVCSELDAARRELEQLRLMLEGALDRLDAEVEPPRERNCSPSRSRTLMSHYQWLRDHGHQDRASTALAKCVEQTGDKPARLNSAAWSLMTDKETAGKFDSLALALVKRMEQSHEPMQHHHLDTSALAHFLNGEIDVAIELQQRAIEGSGNDDYRRRLRTYETARAEIAKARTVRDVVPGATLVAGGDD